jgi:HK97 family phage prohead protease
VKLTTDELFAALDTVPNLRSAAFDEVEVGQWSEGFRFEGHAAVFDTDADVGNFTESVERGAFRKVLASDENIPMFYDHQRGLPLLASTRAGTLTLTEDVKGLAVVADIADTSLGRDLRVLAARGDVRAMSYGFVVGRGNSKVEMRGVKAHRSLTGFKHLLDVSPTWDPVFRSAEGQFRSLTMQYADDPDALQQLHAGAYPQLVEQGSALENEELVVDERTDEEREAAELEEARSNTPPEGETSGAHTQRAARKRRLMLMSITLPKE